MTKDIENNIIPYFPPPHKKEFEIHNGHRRRRFEPGWVVGHYGNIFIKELTPKNKRRYAFFKCGSSNDFFEARIDSVDGDSIKSCGCRKHFTSAENACKMGQQNYGKYKENIAGKVFGELTVVKPTNQRDYDGNILWKCQCSCGEGVRLASYKSLRTGHVKYCSKCNRIRQAQKYIGKKFGKLTITSIISDKNKRAENGGLYCRAVCDCSPDKKLEIPLNYITRENGQQSCGKCTISKGENKIKNILLANSIYFVQQESFSKAIKSPYGGFCKFDFYLPNQNTVIEYNGEQHYFPIEYFGGQESFQKTRVRDSLKKKYCIENNIRYIEIPYWDYDKISFDYFKIEKEN